MQKPQGSDSRNRFGKYRIRLTNHVIFRYSHREYKKHRFNDEKSQKFLDFLKSEEISPLILQLKQDIKNSQIDKSVFNNTSFMDRMYQRHGYDQKLVFLVNGNKLFICKEEPNGKDLVFLTFFKNCKIRGFSHK